MDKPHSPSPTLKREVPTWFQADGCSEEKKHSPSYAHSYSCPVTPAACGTEQQQQQQQQRSPTSSRNQLALPGATGTCHCSHVPQLPLAPCWLLYREADPSPSASPSSECSSPLDLSCKSSSYDGFESDDGCESPGSILRSLLSPMNPPHGAVQQTLAGSPMAPVGIQVQVEDCDKDAQPRDASQGCYGDTPVRLAKKNIYPVTARVSQWLGQIVKFAQEVPSFKSLAQREQVHILQNSWHRLLLLCMAEDNFCFAVSASPHNASSTSLDPPDANANAAESLALEAHQQVPTVRFVESLQGLIRKMQAFKLDHIQYSLLSTAVLFYTGNIDNLGLLADERIQELKRVYENVLTLLRQHMMNTETPNRSSSSSSSSHSLSPSKSFVRDNVQLYSKLLRMLPSIYSVHKSLVHSLFCTCVGLDVDNFIASMISANHECSCTSEKRQ